MSILKMKKFYKRYERILIPSMLIFGVIVDFVTFRTIEIKLAFIILFVYWLVAGGTISFLLRTHEIQRSESYVSKYFKIFAPLIIQFTFGALLSASFIFYWFSGSFFVSWPLMALIAFLMISNETFQNHYMKPTIQIGVFYFITFSLFSLTLPYLFNSISAWIFILSGGLSLIIFYLYLKFFLFKYSKVALRQQRLKIIIMIIFSVMNFLYFTNLIPPIPLSLTDAGIYHNIKRVDGNYILLQEDQTFLNEIIPGEVINIKNGDSVYVFSSIFAPVDLKTKIIHQWQYFNDEENRWIIKDELSFSIYGGRQSGYRGYSQKSALHEGKWRVYVQTERGQTIGVLRFKINFIDNELKLEKIVK